MEPDIVEILLGIVVTGLAWWMKTIWITVKELQNKQTAMELDIAKNYSTKNENALIMVDFNRKLDKIGNLELLFAQHETRRISADKQLDSITSRLDVIYEELIKK
jgi:hypothetical protein